MTRRPRASRAEQIADPVAALEVQLQPDLLTAFCDLTDPYRLADAPA